MWHQCRAPSLLVLPMRCLFGRASAPGYHPSFHEILGRIHTGNLGLLSALTGLAKLCGGQDYQLSCRKSSNNCYECWNKVLNTSPSRRLVPDRYFVIVRQWVVIYKKLHGFRRPRPWDCGASRTLLQGQRLPKSCAFHDLSCNCFKVWRAQMYYRPWGWTLPNSIHW